MKKKIETVVAEGQTVTRDLGGKASTREGGEALAAPSGSGGISNGTLRVQGKADREPHRVVLARRPRGPDRRRADPGGDTRAGAAPRRRHDTPGPRFVFSSRRRHTSWNCDWSSDVCSSDLDQRLLDAGGPDRRRAHVGEPDAGLGDRAAFDPHRRRDRAHRPRLRRAVELLVVAAPPGVDRKSGG